MDLHADLIRLGLSQQQAKVYLACLQLGQASVLNIARTSGLKRPTVYVLLEQLQQLHLVTTTKQLNKTLYLAESPTRLVEHLAQQQQIATALLPSLQALHNVDPEKPTITIEEGIAGVRKVYTMVFDYLRLHTTEELLIYGALEDAKEYFEIEVLDYFYSMIKETQNPIRELGNNDLETRRYARQALDLNPNYSIRYMQPADGAFVKADNMLFGNTIVLFSVKEKIFATIIESKNLADSYRAMFNMAWRGGKKL
ncbi:MAG TPA: hypothetical protein DEG44_04755 [Candidatus Kerfeldbacteria bacterium]|nr:hypothetical protein [Candidatus Kerfeldbacteria bacterium]